MVRPYRLRFAVLFALSCIGLYTLVYALPPAFLRPINEHTARALGLVLNVFGIAAVTAADTVSENGLAFRIIPECTPVFTAGLFLSFVAFHTASLRRKSAGIAWGFLTLYLGNLIRLVLTFMVSRRDRAFFEVSHVYLGQIFTLILVIACCLLWMRWVEHGGERKASTESTTGFLLRFSLLSAALVLIWLRVHHGYIGVLDQLLSLGFSHFGRAARLARENPVYYETFSIVIVASLVLAAGSVPWRTRLPALGAGLCILFMIHLLHRFDNTLMALYDIAVLQPLDLTGLVIGQYLVPALVLIYLIRGQRRDVAADVA